MTNLTSYTLLADDSAPLSRENAAYREFKAHLIYTVIINGGIVFSDNQIVTSPNLRLLTRQDGVIKQLFRDKYFAVAMRENFNGSERRATIREIHEAFVNEGKIARGSFSYDFGNELDFLEHHAVKRGWSYEQIRENYTRDCEQILLRCFSSRVDAESFARFRDAIAFERERDGGLGRQFIQYRLREQMVAQGVPFSDDDQDMVRRCSDAPYVSNLPRTIGLNPIYAPQHADSFQLVRGCELRFVDVDAPRDIAAKIPYSHFVEGLIQLDLDDINALHQTTAFRQLTALQASEQRDQQNFDAIEEAFLELNIEIEDRIVSRFPGLRQHSPGDQKKRLRRQAAVTFDHGTAVATDMLTLALDFLSGVPFLGTGTKLIFDRVTDRIEAGDLRPKLGTAAYLRQKRALEEHLRSLDKAQMLNIEELITTQGFPKETVVR